MEDTAWKRHNIDSLNEETECVSYVSGTNTVTITSIADFICALKLASKNLGAFDDLDETHPVWRRRR